MGEPGIAEQTLHSLVHVPVELCKRQQVVTYLFSLFGCLSQEALGNVRGFMSSPHSTFAIRE